MANRSCMGMVRVKGQVARGKKDKDDILQYLYFLGHLPLTLHLLTPDPFLIAWPIDIMINLLLLQGNNDD